MDFYQTCTDTLLGRGKVLVRFWWPWPHLQGHTSTLKFSSFDQKSLSAPYLLNQMTDSGQTSSIVTLGWFKILIRFWWPWPIFLRSPHYKVCEMFKFWPKKKKKKKKSLSAPYLLNQMTDSGQTSHIVTLRLFKDLFRFWWHWYNFQGHHTIKTVKMSLLCTLSPEPIGGF